MDNLGIRVHMAAAQKPKKPGTKPKKSRKNPELAQAIAERIRVAMVQASIGTKEQLEKLTGLQDRTLRRVLGTEEKLPTEVAKVETLMNIARVCKVSLDWLVFAADPTPAAYYQFIKTPTGAALDEDTQEALHMLPTHGYPATIEFYEHAYRGLRKGFGPVEAERFARLAMQNARSVSPLP